MKTREEIEDRIRALLALELDRRVVLASRRLPARCIHNHQQELDPRPQIEEEPNPSYNRVDRRHLPVINKMGLCMLGAETPEAWGGTICEDAIDAQRCPTFTPFETKDNLLENFHEDLSDVAWVERHMPEVYGLLWVLDEGALHLALPWWKRWWFRWLRVRVEPIAPPFDLARLLPPPQEKTEDDDGISSP